MPKKTKNMVTCLEIKMPCGEVFYLSPPMTMIFRNASPVDLVKGWGNDDVLVKLAKDDVVAIKGRDDAKDDIYVICKPFEWMRWVEIGIDGKPAADPATFTTLDKFKNEE